MKAMSLVIMFLLIGLAIYGFLKLRGTVRIFIICAILVIGFYVGLYFYLNE